MPARDRARRQPYPLAQPTPDTARTPRPAALILLAASRLDPLLELAHDVRVAQRRHVAELAPLGDVAQQPAHDLARARLRQVARPDDALRARELADPLGDC